MPGSAVGADARASAVRETEVVFPPTMKERRAMDILEIEQKETLSREEAAARMRAIADMLFEREGTRIVVKVPDEVRLKIELEVETDERELEIELKW